MMYDYSKLLGKMKERGFTQEGLAAEIGVNEGTLSSKLNSKYAFKQNEMDAICRVLDIPNDEIGSYFFAR